MFSFLKRIKKHFSEECGQDMVEFALLMALIAMGAVIATKSTASSVKGVYTTIVNTLQKQGQQQQDCGCGNTA